MDEQSTYVETEDQHVQAESMSPESVDSTQGATTSCQLPPSPHVSSDRDENRYPAFFLSDEWLSRICSDTVNGAYEKAIVLEERSLGLFGDVTQSPPRLSSQGSLTAGEEVSGRPVSGRSASPRRRPFSGRERRSSSSHCSQTSKESRASSGHRSGGELLSPEAKLIMILAQIITEGSVGTPGSIDLGQASPSSTSSSSSRRSTPTTTMAASNIITFVLDGTKKVNDPIPSYKLSPEVENSVEVNLKRLRTLDVQVPVVVDEGDNNPTSHTDSSRGSSPCPMRAFLASKDLKAFLQSTNVRGFSKQLISHVARILLESKEAKTAMMRRCSSDTAVDKMTGGLDDTTDQSQLELMYSFVEGAVKNLLETFLSLPHSPPAETYLEDYSCMEEKNWVASPNSSCDSSLCWDADDEESLTETYMSSSRESVQERLSDVISIGTLLLAENAQEHSALEDSEVSSVEGLITVNQQEFGVEEFISMDMLPLHADDTEVTFPEPSSSMGFERTPATRSSSTTNNSSATTPETQTRAESTEVGCCHTFCPCLRQKKAVGPAVEEPKIPRKSKEKSCMGKSSKNSVARVPADAPAAQKSKKPGFARRFAAATFRAFCFGCCPKKIKH